MYRIDDATAATSIPTPETAGTEGYFTEGNPGTGTPATKVRGSWLNMIQEELRAIVVAGGLTPSKTTYTQVRDAIKALIAQPQTNLVSGVVGQVRNLVMNVPAVSSTATLTADEIIVETALGGVRYCLSNFNKTINLATTGAGGMDTGSPPAPGFVAIYAIYNPTSGASALLAANATSSTAPAVYGGANMPSGYTASALVSVWPVGSGSQLGVGFQADRFISITTTSIISTSTQQASLTSLAMTGVVPRNAKTFQGYVAISSTSNANFNTNIAGSSTGVGSQASTAALSGGGASIGVSFGNIPIITPQTLFYSCTVSTGTMTFGAFVSGYTF